ncbi:MAG: hypothetical protein EAZ91_00590 [Cytophagales bacterium]|nr:MAG: hypothetical protein EAZ91_00590 [Cytophagales bacterium]
MTTYQVNVLNPKADKLLHDLVDLQLISIVRVPSNKSVKKSSLPKNKRLTQLLISGPELTDEQLNTIQETRKAINQWRKKPS